MSSKGKSDRLAELSNVGKLDYIINNYSKIKVAIDYHTPTDPYTLMGIMGNVCLSEYDPNLPLERYDKIATQCVTQNHGRVIEFPDVYFIIDGSAKMMRELYTHIIGVSRLQQSTRYSKHEDEPFDFFVPPTVSLSEEALELYENCCKTIGDTITKIKELGIPHEDATMLLPIGYMSEMVLKCTARSLINLSNQRLCNKAYHEIRVVLIKMLVNLALYSDQWKKLIIEIGKPKCFMCGGCPENKPCTGIPVNISEIIYECEQRGLKQI